MGRPLILLLVLCTLLWSRDRLELEDGRVLEGEVLRQDAEWVELRSGGATHRILKEDLKRMELDLEADKFYLAAEGVSSVDKRIAYYRKSILAFPERHESRMALLRLFLREGAWNRAIGLSAGHVEAPYRVLGLLARTLASNTESGAAEWRGKRRLRDFGSMPPGFESRFMEAEFEAVMAIAMDHAGEWRAALRSLRRVKKAKGDAWDSVFATIMPAGEARRLEARLDGKYRWHLERLGDVRVEIGVSGQGALGIPDQSVSPSWSGARGEAGLATRFVFPLSSRSNGPRLALGLEGGWRAQSDTPLGTNFMPGSFVEQQMATIGLTAMLRLWPVIFFGGGAALRQIVSGAWGNKSLRIPFDATLLGTEWEAGFISGLRFPIHPRWAVSLQGEAAWIFGVNARPAPELRARIGFDWSTRSRFASPRLIPAGR